MKYKAVKTTYLPGNRLVRISLIPSRTVKGRWVPNLVDRFTDRVLWTGSPTIKKLAVLVSKTVAGQKGLSPVEIVEFKRVP